MPRRAEPPRRRVKSIRSRKFRSPRDRKRPNWPVIAIVVAAVVVVGIVVTLLLLSRGGGSSIEATEMPSPTPVEQTPVTETPTEEPTATGMPAPRTLTPAATPTATPIPEICLVVEQTWVRNRPTEDTIGLELLAAGARVGVIGEVQSEEGVWYLLAGYVEPAYIQAGKVQCPAP